MINETNTEITVIPTGEQYIAQAVAEVSKTDVAIEELRAKYAGLTVKSLDERPVYFAIVEGEKIVKKIRNGIDHKRKELNEFPLKFQRAVNAEAKRITEQLEPLEAHLKAERKKFEDAEAAEKAKEEARKRGLLIEAGFRFDGTMYTCGVHLIAASSIAGMEEAKLEFYCQEARAIREQERLAEERRKDEQKRLDEQRREQQAEERRLEEKRRELDRKLAEINAAKAPIAVPEEFTAPATPVQEIPNPFAQAQTEPVLAAQEWVAPKAPVAQKSAEYIDGYEHCRTAVLELFADSTKRSRAEFIAQIQSLQP